MSFSRLFEQLSSQLSQQPDHRLELSLSNVSAFSCQRGGMCCTIPWKVDVDLDYYTHWHQKLADFAGENRPVLIPYEDLVLAQGAYAYVVKRAGSHQCVFQADDHQCKIHAELGESALPQLCRTFPREVPAVGERYRHLTLTSACSQAAAMLDQQADLLFQIIPAAQAITSTEPKLKLNAQQSLSLPELLPWLGWLLDQIFDVRQTPSQALYQAADLLIAAEQQPDRQLSDWLAQGWPHHPFMAQADEAFNLFIANAPFSDLLLRFVQRQQRLRLPWPQLELRSRQRLLRFLRNYLLRRLLNLEPLHPGPLTLGQYLWLLGFGLLSIQILLAYRLGSDQHSISLDDLVWCLNRWEQMGMQHPHWQRQLGLASWEDQACLKGLQQLAGFQL